MKSSLAIALGLALTLSLAAWPAASDSESEAAAVEAANRWLALVDSDQLDQSWQRAASLFRQAVTREQWAQSVSAARQPFGRFASRKVRQTQYASSLPGAPDGRYVVIQYDAVYEHKQSAIETVTPMWDGGEWRVSGYYIR